MIERDDSYKLHVQNHDILTIRNPSSELLRITPEGTVIAPNMEAASEAGRVFVESIRQSLDGIRLAERAAIVAWLVERERESLNGHVVAGIRLAIEAGEHAKPLAPDARG